ncbi:MAG: tetratricopeptide repeat protein [Proteobacteria bacterium]|nr:tetratricopeptide repeat protein [Pseudomonadota bacterium]
MKGCALVAALVACASPSTVLAWEPLRSSNAHVEAGNEHMAEGDSKAALAAYDRAARELPDRAGVHLNRGLALLASGELAKARQALLLGTEPGGGKDVRGAAYYNLGVAFYREAERKASENDPEQAQRLFREAADALGRSLRIKPGQEHAAWNLELALRRIREQQEKQKEKEREEEQKADDQQKQGDQQKPEDDQQKPGDDKQDQDPQQREEQQPQEQDSQQQQPEQKPEQQPEQQDEAQQDQGQQDPAKAPEPQPPDEPSETPDRLPQEVEKALDALQAGEDSLERHRAHLRAARQGRRVLKDW